MHASRRKKFSKTARLLSQSQTVVKPNKGKVIASLLSTVMLTALINHLLRLRVYIPGKRGPELRKHLFTFLGSLLWIFNQIYPQNRTVKIFLLKILFIFWKELKTQFAVINSWVVQVRGPYWKILDRYKWTAYIFSSPTRSHVHLFN